MNRNRNSEPFVRIYPQPPKDSSIYNTHFTAIPFNAPNKPGAMILADFLISVEAQLSKYNPDKWGDFLALDLGPATLGSDILNPLAVPEKIPSEFLEALEQGWKEHVLDK